MTREEFKARWESNELGGGISHEDIAECAKKWGLYSKPKTNPMEKVIYDVLKAADVEDAEEFNPNINKSADYCDDIELENGVDLM